MADDAAAKAEKLAAAKKRVEALKKKKTGGKKDKKAKVEEEPATEDKAESKDDAAATETEKDKDKEIEEEKEEKEEDTKDNNKEDEEDDTPGSPASPKLAPPSLSEQSRLRSASFRHGGPLSPTGTGDGETAADIYRKQSARIEELERQNKRLAKEAVDAQKRLQTAEDALLEEEDSNNGNESSSSSSAAALAALTAEVAALKRQNTQLQAQARSTPRHGASPSMSVGGGLPAPSSSAELETQLRSKTQTIETMELEMSRLRAQVERLSVRAGGGKDNEGSDDGEDANGEPTHGRQAQIAALEDKLERAERAASAAQRELAELKRNLDRTSEKAVREGSARTSAETQVRALEKACAEATGARDELAKKVESLEIKATTLTTLHKEHDARSQALRRELADARTRLERVEAENQKLRKREANDGAGGTDDEHLDELLLASSPEQSARVEQLERRVRELEAENTDLRHGIWHERRKELQVGPDGTGFSDVDLSGTKQRGAGASGAIGGFFSALAGGGGGGGGASGQHGRGPSADTEGFLDDDDVDFDEDAFRRAHEEEARLRIERVKEAKRALKNWEGWRLDLVESRQGGAEGIGPIFEI